MKYERMKSGAICVPAVLLLCLAGCGGTKVLKKPESFVVSNSLATASDQHLVATLDWVIFRDGPGTWAKNADWDEYLLRVQNPSTDSTRVTNITVLDSLETRIDSRASRKLLVEGTKETQRRYKGEGIKVKAGASAGTLLAGGAVAGAGTVAIVASSIGYSTYGGYTMGTGAAAAATGGLILIPVFAVSGIMRGVNNSKVDKAIQSRQTALPFELQEGEEQYLNVFFPLTPSPRQIEVVYTDSRGEHVLIIDTRAALEGLHLVPGDK